MISVALNDLLDNAKVLYLWVSGEQKWQIFARVIVPFMIMTSWSVDTVLMNGTTSRSDGVTHMRLYSTTPDDDECCPSASELLLIDANSGEYRTSQQVGRANILTSLDSQAIVLNQDRVQFLGPDTLVQTMIIRLPLAGNVAPVAVVMQSASGLGVYHDGEPVPLDSELWIIPTLSKSIVFWTMIVSVFGLGIVFADT